MNWLWAACCLLHLIFVFHCYQKFYWISGIAHGALFLYRWKEQYVKPKDPGANNVMSILSIVVSWYIV